MIRLTDAVAWNNDGSRWPSRAVRCPLYCNLCIYHLSQMHKHEDSMTRFLFSEYYLSSIFYSISPVLFAAKTSLIGTSCRVTVNLSEKVFSFVTLPVTIYLNCLRFLWCTSRERNTREISRRSRYGADTVRIGVNVTQYTFLIQLPESDR